MQSHYPDGRESLAVTADHPLSDTKRGAFRTAADGSGHDTRQSQSDQTQVYDRFQLLEKIGVGGFGTVWKAHDKDLDRDVALKVPRQGQTDARQAKRFLQEARTASQLRHPGIVSVYDVGRQGESVYIVADYIAGQTLDEWRQSQEPTAGQVAELCRAIAEATHYAHESGVIHRDLKPSNIIVDSSDSPHITDFGLAKRTADDATLTAAGQISGTPAYMSPEQVQADSRQIDRRTDVYALGVILFELLTGERPFRGSVPMLIHQVVENEAPSPRELSSDIPRELDNICLKCLEKDPRHRYQSASALAEDLRRFLDSEPVKARPIPRHVRVWRWCKRNRLATGVTASMFLVLLVGMAATTSQWLRAETAAVREAERRAEIELLTQQVLKLAERLRALEKSPPTANLSATRQAEARKDARLSLSYSQLREPSAVGEGRPSPAVTKPSAHLSRFSSDEVRGRATLGRAAPRPKKESELSGLQAEARTTLQRLEQLSPAVAQRCRGAFPELVSD